jgi:DNA-binding HxlR family transcriptional regulator
LSTLEKVKRSYRQACAVAKALDIVGNRWSLLIVRELLIGPRRFSDLMDALSGIGTNLLSQRLRELQEAGVVGKRTLPPPAGSVVYELSERGQDLAPAVLDLAHWGTPLLAAPKRGEEFRTQWLVLAGQAAFRPEAAPEAEISCELRASETDASYFSISDGRFEISEGPLAEPDLVLVGKPSSLIELLAGQVSAAQALANGVEIKGERATLNTLLESLEFRAGPTPPAPRRGP